MELRNYRKFRTAALEFPDGVIGIIGQNGSGKSTLVEAIAWCLYGNEKSIVRTGKEGVRSSAAGPNDECSVLLVFSIEGDEYRLHRSMKGSSLSMDATLSVNGALKAKGDRHVTAAVEKLLGMDYTSFFISVFARQKELNALSSLNPADRKRYVLRMLSLDALDEVVKLIDQDGNEMRKVRDALQAELISANGRMRKELLTEEIRLADDEVNEVRNELRSIEARLAEADEKVQQTKALRDALAGKDQEYRRVQHRQIELSVARRNTEDNLTALQRQLEELKVKAIEMDRSEADSRDYEGLLQEREGLETRSELFKQRSQLRQLLEGLSEKSAKLESEVASMEQSNLGCEEARTRLEEVERNLERARDEREEMRHMVKSLESEISRFNKQLQELDLKLTEIVRLGPEGKCPTCERELQDQHTVLKGKLELELKETSAGLAELKRRKQEGESEVVRIGQKLEALEKRRKDRDQMCSRAVRASEGLDRLRSQLSAIDLEGQGYQQRLASIGEVEFDEAHYNSVKRRIIDLKPKAERYRELRAQVARLPEVQADLERRMMSRDDLRERTAQVERELVVLGYQEGSYREAQDQLDASISEKQRIDQEIAQKSGLLALKKSEASSKRQRLMELMETEKKVEERSRIMEEQTILSKTMKDFKSNIVGRVVPTLAEISSHMFSELTDSKYPGLELNDNYEMSVYDKGEKYSLARFSGGETDLANLCLRLAISRVIAERSGSAVNFLILDEIFGSQDQVHKRNILEAFSQLSKQFRQIILITHIEDVKDLVGNAVMVRENEDGSSSASAVS